MTITIDDPILAAFVAEEVRSGRFASAKDVVAVVLTQFMAADDAAAAEFDNETLAALDESLEQAAKGETLTPEEAAARMGIALPARTGRPSRAAGSDAETAAKVARARVQLDRGEGIPAATVRREWRDRIDGP